MRVSAVLIMKNEEVMIEACLKSLVGFGEIIIVDTGSTDSSQKKALKHVGHIYEFPWVDDFAAARNFALSKATGDWVMSIDADHILQANYGEVLLAAEKLEKDGHRVGAITLESQGHRHFTPWLFKRDPDLFWVGKVHETLSRVADARAGILQTYKSSPAHALDPDRNLRILLSIDPKEPRDMFYLGRTYAERGEPAKAIHWMHLYLKKATWAPEIGEALLTLAKSYWALSDGNAARHWCGEAIRHNPSFREALAFMAEVHYEPWKAKWLRLASTADNQDVLFIR